MSKNCSSGGRKWVEIPEEEQYECSFKEVPRRGPRKKSARRKKVHQSLMNSEQTVLPAMDYASLCGALCLPSLPGDVVTVVRAALIVLILRDCLGGELP
jgi:hypothetical protein